MNKENSLSQLQFFLKEMFQFDANDLDFGIFRIYNLKREEVENFIDGNDSNCLRPIVETSLELVANIDTRVRLSDLTLYVKKFNQENLISDPVVNYDKIHHLITGFSSDELERENLISALDSSTKSGSVSEEIKDKIYSHILGFFEMYYSNGDFGFNNRSRSLYKIPYESDYDGNDTLFHWKHKGSLYIKSGSSFNAIKFKLKHLDTEFELRLETNSNSILEQVARNNNRDTQLKHYRFDRIEEIDGVTRIIFNLSDTSTSKAEVFKAIFTQVLKSDENLDKYLFAKNDKGDVKSIFNDLTNDYDKIQDGGFKGLSALRVNRKTVLGKVNKNFDKTSRIEILDDRFTSETLDTIYNIDQKLNSFYVGNDSDYFIHENLNEFLTQEKERYIKNYILSDLKTILDGKLDNTTIVIAKAFDLVSSKIVDFLCVIEEFQKKLFTMKKKVVECEFCLTLDNIDEEYYDQIFKNEQQLLEWEKLFKVKVESPDDLKAQPTLVLDTKFFRQPNGLNPFKDQILAHIDNLDQKTGGLLIKTENHQGLNLIQDKYRGKIKCIYIDPPYNTDAAPILYKNHFRHSSWLSLIENRLTLSTSLLSSNESSALSIAIDDSEVSNLLALLNENYGDKFEFHKAIVIHYPGSGSGRTNITRTHEYNIFMIKKDEDVLKGKSKENGTRDRGFRRAGTGENNYRYGRENSFFAVLVDPNTLEIVGFEPPPPLGSDYPRESTNEGILRIYPIGKDGSERVWSLSYEGALENRDKLECSKNMTINRRFEDGKGKRTLLKSIWFDSQFNATTHGTNLLTDIFGQSGKFPYPKSVYTVFTAIDSIGWSKNDYTVLDYYGGSGTTAHAILKLNQDGGERKYILMEMGEYFDSVTMPRIQKAIYSDNWKGGKPLDNEGATKHIFKYIVLEQYEDVLDAIEKVQEELPKNLPLKYLYKPEINQINSSLDISRPFQNRVKYGHPTKEGFIDLVETYNFLLGNEIKTVKTYTIKNRYYKVVEMTDVLVIWRNIDLGVDDSAAIIQIAKKYPEVTKVEVNFEFNILASVKDSQLEVGERLIDLKIIHVDVFNQ